MLIRTLQELRLYNTSHALDDIEPLMGIIDNVEKDILVDKLGKSLYTALCSHYKNVDTDLFVKAVQEDSLDNDMDVLLRLSQAVVANEVINHAIALHLVSLNNSGLNMGSAEDYAVASKDAVETSRKELYQLTHIAINTLLEWLEEKAQAIPATPNPDPSPVDGEGSADNEQEGDGGNGEEEETVHGSVNIAELWRESPFYWQTITLLPHSFFVNIGTHSTTERSSCVCSPISAMRRTSSLTRWASNGLNISLRPLSRVLTMRISNTSSIACVAHAWLCWRAVPMSSRTTRSVSLVPMMKA